ncbi:MAG: RNA pseudouridine synthase [Hymenobacter sp.]
MHRIDKDTSGLLVIGKTEFAMTHLSLAVLPPHHSAAATWRLVWGTPKEAKGTVRGHIGRSLRDRKVQAVYPGGEQGKAAVTHYEVLRNYGPVTLISCVLETGRTHQIRAHMQHLGHPLFNDATYGGNRIRVGPNTASYRAFVENASSCFRGRLCMPSSLGFVQPTTGQATAF